MNATFQQPATPDSPRPFPPATLIICTRDRAQMLRETVSSILAAREVPDELIIVDQSQTGLPLLDRLPNDRGCVIRQVKPPHIGASSARNLGMRLASHDILVLIDDDMQVDPGWFGAMLNALIQGGPRTVVTGMVAPALAEKPDQFVIAVHAWQEPAIYAGRIYKDILASGHMALYRSAFVETGGFDERLGPGTRFPGAEDNDLGFRLLEAGYRLIYCPDSVVYHRAWRERREYISLFRGYGLGQGAFYAKHAHQASGYMLSRFKKDALRFLRLAPRRIWQRQLLVLLGSAAFIWGEIEGALAWWVSQKRGQA